MVGPGQALIEVAFANITFVDTQLRANGAGPYPAKLPMILGNGVGGVVTSVGADVDKGLVAKRVVSSTSGSGGYDERAVVDAGGIVEVPDGLDLDGAVALLADGRTAMTLVRAAGLRGGERVLVEAAAGGVGTLLVFSSYGRPVPGSSRRLAGGARSSWHVSWAPRWWLTTGSRGGPSVFGRLSVGWMSSSTGSAAPSVDQRSNCSTAAGR